MKVIELLEHHNFIFPFFDLTTLFRAVVTVSSEVLWALDNDYSHNSTYIAITLLKGILFSLFKFDFPEEL